QDRFLSRALLRGARGADAGAPAELCRPGVGRGGVDQELRRCRRHAHHAALRRRARAAPRAGREDQARARLVAEPMPKLGYLLPTRERVMEGQPETGPLLALAEKAEGLGFDSIWVGDSVTAKPRHDPLVLLAALAGRTRKAELGTAVLLPALRNPVLLAHQAATLDRLCEGRLILGIGIAADTPAVRRDFEATGVPFDKRVARMNEAMQLCRALWTGQPVDWTGLWT